MIQIDRGDATRGLAKWTLPTTSTKPTDLSLGRLSPLEKGLYSAIRIRSFVALGQAVEARETLRSGVENLRELEARGVDAICEGALTALVEQAEGADGVRVLAGLNACLTAQAGSPQPAYIETLVLTLVAEYSAGRTEAAVRRFLVATSAAAELGSWRAFLAPGRRDAVLSVLALARATADHPDRSGAQRQLELLLKPQVDPRETVALTPKEQEVLLAMFHDLPSSAIARRMHVSPNTVKSQIRSIYRKLGVSSRDEALARAASAGVNVQVRDRRRHRT
jgi:DNA-binding CsgD family transcriptional regulator